MSSKYLQDVETRKPKFIHVYPNGDEYVRARFIILKPVEQKDLDLIIKAIEEKVRLPRNRPIRKIFEMSGVLVTDCIQIEDGNYYVAASAENFFNLSYGQGIGWIRVGPVRTSKYASVHYISKAEEEGNSKSLSSSSNMLALSKDTKQRASKPKSQARKTPASIKKNSRHKPQNNMTTSEFVETLPINDDKNRNDFERVSGVKSSDDIVDNLERNTFINEVGDNRAEKDFNMNKREEDQKEVHSIGVIETNHEQVLEHERHHSINEQREKQEEEKLDIEVKKEEIEEIIENLEDKIENLVENEVDFEEKIENFEESKESGDRNFECEQEGEPIIEKNEHEENMVLEETKKDSSNIEECLEINKLGENTNRNEEIRKDSEDNCNKEEESGENDIGNDIEMTTETTNEDNVDQELLDGAATKIQASFRGHRVRSEIEKSKETFQTTEEVSNNTEVKEEVNSQIEES